MHGQLVARYESERLSNGMPRVVPYSNMREPIKEGYYPKLIRNTNMRSYAGRPPNTTLKDLNRPDAGIVVTVAQVEAWLDQIILAIQQGFVIDTAGRQIPITNDQGIDILGNIIEASSLSVNQQLYGDWHNTGHDLFAYSHDPDGRYLEDIGVMGDVTTAMRDPIFYRFHKHVDDIFDRHKRLLPQYNRAQLSFAPVAVNSVMCRIPKETAAPNVLLTFWQRSQVDLSGGLDFQSDGPAFVSFVHLQHADFDYVLDISNNSSGTLLGTCRIFLAPKCDENCREFHFNEARKLMVELDKFTVSLTPGENRIVRSSLNSSVTISWEKSFQAIGKLTKLDPNMSPRDLQEFEFCGCGWPHHLLLPKGSEGGSAFKLFVMISNLEDDVVNQVIPENVECGDAHSFCGLKDQLYPDRRPMGFPFDRPFDVATLDQFVGLHSNMFVQDVNIRHVNQITNRLP
uniref:CSON010253 protein n=1 Tax=Culicoides sonorensis TaxID=179676 RepID=A0A336MYZ2_CULSO